MKKNYYLLLFLTFLSLNFIQAQPCPELIGNQSTTNDLAFKITSGTCGDYTVYEFINVNSAIFQFDGCNGTNLKYTYSSEIPLTSEDTFNTFFGLPLGLCQYENGSLIVLSNKDIALNESVSIYPNPLIKQSELTLKFSTSLSAQVYMYDVTGKLAIRDEVNNVNTKKINTSALTKVYISYK